MRVSVKELSAVETTEDGLVADLQASIEADADLAEMEKEQTTVPAC